VVIDGGKKKVGAANTSERRIGKGEALKRSEKRGAGISAITQSLDSRLKKGGRRKKGYPIRTEDERGREIKKGRLRRRKLQFATAVDWESYPRGGNQPGV